MPDKHNVSWKTGTSWGFHDAWTIGVVGNDVLAIWVDNFDVKPNPAFIGIKTAAPLFFQTQDNLRHQRLLSPYSAIEALPPRALSRDKVCSASGDLPNQYYKKLSETWFTPGKSQIKISCLHRPVTIDKATGFAACNAGENTHQEVYEFWSYDMLRIFRDAGMPPRVPPMLPSGCNNAQQTHADNPQITSPLKGVIYTIRLNKPETISLRANRDGQGAIYWFDDNFYIKKTKQAIPSLGHRKKQRVMYCARLMMQGGRIVVR